MGGKRQMTDIELQKRGLEILARDLGVVEAERFVFLLMKEPIDYTEWRETAFGDLSLDKTFQSASELWKKNH
jgi:hypothetical protein